MPHSFHRGWPPFECLCARGGAGGGEGGASVEASEHDQLLATGTHGTETVMAREHHTVHFHQLQRGPPTGSATGG